MMPGAITMNTFQSGVMPMNNSFQTSYQENQVYTASREELILMLYDGALKFMRAGIYALEEKNIPQVGYNILRAQKIVHYLDLTLNMEAGKEVAENLHRLYDYVNNSLFEAQRNNDSAKIQEMIKIVETLREGWFLGVVKKEK